MTQKKTEVGFYQESESSKMLKQVLLAGTVFLGTVVLVENLRKKR